MIVPLSHLQECDSICPSLKLQCGVFWLNSLALTSYLSNIKRARPGIAPAIAFLTTRVRNPDTGNKQPSICRQSRHLNIRMFFVVDQKAKGHIDIQYCPADLMMGNYMMKPLYGKTFVQFRQKIMNLPLMAQLLLIACVIA
jgi:hypothetical protein